MRLTWNNCKQDIIGNGEDDLVAQVQAHVGEHRRRSGRPHAVTREQILARLAATRRS